MDFQISAEAQGLRREVREFLRRELPPDWPGVGIDFAESDDGWAFHRRMKRKVAERGWLALAWPQEYGGQGASLVTQATFTEEMAYHHAPGWDIFGVRMLGPVLMRFGTQEQKERFLPPIARGEVEWCQGYSEPGTGSDLASVQTEAVEDGDDFVINGSKMWTTQGHRADWMFLLARTDPDAPKHKGISFLLCDMKSPGITVRPLVNMSGVHTFNQVFFDNLRVPRANLVGEKNRGWYVGLALLDFERSAVDFPARARRLVEDVAALLAGRREARGPTFWVHRHALADRFIESQVGLLMSYRVAWLQDQGQVPNREASIVKLFGSELLPRAAQTALRALGLWGHLARQEPRAPLRGWAAQAYLETVAPTIFSGASEIQRNIIATRGLGLPRD